MSKKKKPSLPERRGKKTGKRGIGPPLDPEADFEKPVTKQEPMSAGPKGSLLVEQPPKPAIANGRMKVFYDKPIFSKAKDRVLIALQFSVPLEREHDSLLPRLIAEAHKDCMKKGRVRINLNGIPAQRAVLFISAEHEEELVSIPACKMINVNVAMVQRKGEGTARRVARLAFRLQTERTEQLATFGELNLNNDFWMTLENSQESLWDEDEQDSD